MFADGQIRSIRVGRSLPAMWLLRQRKDRDRQNFGLIRPKNGCESPNLSENEQWDFSSSTILVGWTVYNAAAIRLTRPLRTRCRVNVRRRW